MFIPPLTQRAIAQYTWVVEVVDFGNLGPNGSYGLREPSLTLDSQAWPHIAYFDAWNRSLKHAFKDASGWHTEIVDRADCFPPDFEGPSLVLDSLDQAWIAYGAATTPCDASWDVRLAHWNGAVWDVQTVDPPGTVAGWQPSLDLDALDRPRIAFFANMMTDPEVWYAEWDGGSWRYESVVAGDFLSVMPHPSVISLKVDSRGNPGLAYAQTADFNNLSYYYRNGGVWRWQRVDLTATAEVDYISLALDSRDFPSISYAHAAGEQLRYARWNGSQWILDFPTTFGLTGAESSLAVDSQDEPHISYNHAPSWSGGSDVPDYAYYVRKSGGLWVWPQTPDPTEVGWGPSLALDSHDLPHIAWLFGAVRNGAELRYAYVPWVDTEPPVSNVLPIAPYWNGGPVQAVATDESGVANITLWYRHSTDNSTWGLWTRFSTLVSPPWTWSFTFPRGEGYYEYYSTAVDTMGNVEPPPATADAIEGYDITPPVSTALPISPYWQRSPSIVVTATATDSLSGVADVTLVYSYSQDNSTWSPWTQIETNTSPPWRWPFQFTMGEGYYRFFTIAKDVAGNVEGAKTSPEAIAAYIIRAPVTSLWIGRPNYTHGTTFIKSITPLTLSVIDRGGTGIANTKYRQDNSIWTEYTGQFFLSGDGDHYLEWYSEDNTGNLEEVSWRVLRVDDTPPSMSISPEDPKVSAGTSFTLLSDDGQGCGVAGLEYRIDNGSWITYYSPFTLSEGWHNITYRSWDHLNNSIEKTHMVELIPPEVPPGGKVDVNYKPIVAVIFAIILILVGMWSSKRRPWKGGKDTIAVVKAFMVTPLPFVLAEAGTGIVSLFTGQLSIPPLIGVGTAVDLAILMAGISVALLRALKPETPGAEERENPRSC
jgi:hypothetical protein